MPSPEDILENRELMFDWQVSAAIEGIKAYGDELPEVAKKIKTIEQLVTEIRDAIAQHEENKASEVATRVEAIQNMFQDKTPEEQFQWLARHIADIKKKNDKFQVPACRQVAKDMEIDPDKLQKAVNKILEDAGLRWGRM